MTVLPSSQSISPIPPTDSQWEILYGINSLGPDINPLGPEIRTPASHPWNFDTFTSWQRTGAPRELANASFYSDRLYQWDPDKFNKSRKKISGGESQYFDDSPLEIEKFLREYFSNDDLHLVKIEKGCNQSTGYPVWHFTVYSTNPTTQA